MKHKTFEELLKARLPSAIAHWDEWDYQIFGPVGLDDRPVVTIYLINQNGTRQVLEIELSPMVKLIAVQLVKKGG